MAAVVALPLVVGIGRDGDHEADDRGLVVKTRTTQARMHLRVRSLHGVMGQILRQCSREKLTSTRTSDLAPSVSGPVVGCRLARALGTSSHCRDMETSAAGAKITVCIRGEDAFLQPGRVG